jgi:hypothetical protein
MLDHIKRNEILDLLAIGCSRRFAEQYICCSPGAIIRIASLDPDFARQMAEAENIFNINALNFIREAARHKRYRNAAAWLEERKIPNP